MLKLYHWSDENAIRKLSALSLLSNHMQSPQEIKKAHDLKTLQKNQADWAFIFLLIFYQ